jgi:Tannase and feruloyl esterase
LVVFGMFGILERLLDFSTTCTGVSPVVGSGQVQGFARLFMAPGVFHCGGGTGPQVFDSFGALVRWVESGEAPDRIMASRVENGAVVRTRPPCAYPYVARYDGKGDPSSAESFDCKPNYGPWSPPNNS